MSLVLSDVSFIAGGRKILDKIYLDLNPGELLAVIGPNGSGKSTLLKILSGELKPSSGHILLDGKSLDQYSPAELSMRRSVLSQESEVRFPFTSEEVVRLGRSGDTLRVPKQIEDTLVNRSFFKVDLDERHKQTLFPLLSGGEKQRSQLARVLVQDADPPNRQRYVLLDEPGASLDPNRQHRILILASELASEGRGVLVILHDLNLALRYADRVAVFNDGKLKECGKPEQVLSENFVNKIFKLRTIKIPFPEGKGSFLLPLGPSEIEESNLSHIKIIQENFRKKI
ncbi:heme ABC transporter ATP-binding protein [Leptospira sp. WS92.C1]